MLSSCFLFVRFCFCFILYFSLFLLSLDREKREEIRRKVWGRRRSIFQYNAVTAVCKEQSLEGMDQTDPKRKITFLYMYDLFSIYMHTWAREWMMCRLVLFGSFLVFLPPLKRRWDGPTDGRTDGCSRRILIQIRISSSSLFRNEKARRRELLL